MNGLESPQREGIDFLSQYGEQSESCMRLSTKSEYACLALIELAKNYNNNYTKIMDITEKKSIPKKYLEQIMLVLKGGGIVQSKMGPEGGYKLSRPPEEITLAQVVRLLDGALAPVLSVSEYFYEPSPIEQSRELIGVFSEIREFIAQKMEKTTLADLLPR